jgi:REP element-mobilizing transposase RayT
MKQRYSADSKRMTTARKSLISLRETPYYHCVARCVRRAWLWGRDEYAGKDYSHRKQWVIDRLRELSSVFAVDICAFAVLSNHYHVVLYVDTIRAKGWSDDQVMKHWQRLFRLPTLIERYQRGEATSLAEQDAAQKIISLWRARLMDVSWFMRSLNEHLARRANQEDGCTGRFWEGRFKSQALLDEAGILTAMAYVDLNPIRAGIANTPETSEFTSVFERIRALKGEITDGLTLKPFHGNTQKDPLPCSIEDYLALLDWTGRAVRGGKRGQIDQDAPPILKRLNIDPAAWMECMRPKGNVFGRAMGQLDHLRLHAKALGQQWVKGLRQAERMYRNA